MTLSIYWFLNIIAFIIRKLIAWRDKNHKTCHGPFLGGFKIFETWNDRNNLLLHYFLGCGEAMIWATLAGYFRAGGGVE